MRSYFLAASLVMVACSDDPKPSADDEPVGETREDASTSLDASRDASGRDASSLDARTREDATTVPLDATLVEDAARPEDAAITLPADATITLPEDAGQVEVDAGPPAPVCDPSVAPVVGKLGLQTVVSGGLSYLTEAHQPPDSDDWYLVQQNGIIRVLQNGVLRTTPFLDLSAEVSLANAPIYEDRGLVSIEFAPDYATSGRFYVAITPNRNLSLFGGEANLDQIRSYRRSEADPYVADKSTRQTILSLEGSHLSAADYTTNIHNGGRLTFGPDGMLYHAMGDGGGVNCGDSEPGASQDINSKFGKLLRLDLGNPPTYAPKDNPFVSNGDPLVLHYGLRNPFRFSFDRANGDLFLGDVGQWTYEEVDYAPAGSKGLNFGWATFEGNGTPSCSRPLRPGSVHTPPIVSIDRGTLGSGPFADYNAMIGGVVYRGNALPQLQGIYFFGGYAGARLGALRQCGSKTSPITPVTKACDANSPNEACLRALNGAPPFRELRAIVEDHAGEMYVVANSNTLYKVVPLP